MKANEFFILAIFAIFGYLIFVSQFFAAFDLDDNYYLPALLVAGIVAGRCLKRQYWGAWLVVLVTQILVYIVTALVDPRTGSLLNPLWLVVPMALFFYSLPMLGMAAATVWAMKLVKDKRKRSKSS